MTEDMRNKTCFFTGHRALDEKKVRPLVRDEIIKAYKSSGHCRFFGAGGALGFDMIAAEEVLAARYLYPDIRLILVLPYPDYMRRWKPEDQKRMNDIIFSADKVVYVSSSYSKDAYLARNRRMADCSSRCICYKTKETGGTAYTLSYVKSLIKKGFKFDIVNIAEQI
jgi:uncharacterized phage-like protein YoqJ